MLNYGMRRSKNKTEQKGLLGGRKKKGSKFHSGLVLIPQQNRNTELQQKKFALGLFFRGSKRKQANSKTQRHSELQQGES